jgi:hypothetical protein
MNLSTALVKYHLELNGLMPSEMDWPIELFKDNPPRYIRLKRFYALKKALGLENVSMNQFLGGEFITEDHYKVWDKIYFIVRKEFNIPIEDYLSIHAIIPDLSSLPFLFQYLFEFKKRHHQLMDTGRGVLMASNFYLTPLLIFKEITPKLQTDMHLIDEILDLLTNPNQIQHSEEELNTLFDYPLDDLDEIDLDWL